MEAIERREQFGLANFEAARGAGQQPQRGPERETAEASPQSSGSVGGRQHAIPECGVVPGLVSNSRHSMVPVLRTICSTVIPDEIRARRNGQQLLRMRLQVSWIHCSAVRLTSTAFRAAVSIGSPMTTRMVPGYL